MPDPTRDPIRQLEDFGTGGLTVAPLDPGQVRRLGDRRRMRRRTAYVVAAAAAIVLAIVPVAVLDGRDEAAPPTPAHSGPPSPLPTPPPPAAPTQAPSATATAAPDQVISYSGFGVQVVDSAHTSLLRGAPEDFKAFVGRLADQLTADGQDSCPGADSGVTVKKIGGDEYALGAVNDCGGYVALWVHQGDGWQEALGTQDEWRCGDLTRTGVPASFAGDCYGPSALFGPTDGNGLRLGMSRAEVLAAGGTVTGPTGACQRVTPPGLTPPKNGTLGYLSAMPGKGVVALYAQRDQVTPAGIGSGSTRREVEQAYPGGHLDPLRGSWIAPIDATGHYRFDFDRGFVAQISLEADGPQDCYE